MSEVIERLFSGSYVWNGVFPPTISAKGKTPRTGRVGHCSSYNARQWDGNHENTKAETQGYSRTAKLVENAGGVYLNIRSVPNANDKALVAQAFFLDVCFLLPGLPIITVSITLPGILRAPPAVLPSKIDFVKRSISPVAGLHFSPS